MENSNNFDTICSYNNRKYNKKILVPFYYSNTENTELWKPKHILNKLTSISKNKYFVDNIKQEYKLNVNIIFIVSLPNGIPKEGLLIVGNIKGLGNNKISNGHYLIPIHHDEDIPHCWISTKRINIRKCTEIKLSIFRYIKHYWKNPIVIGELEPHSVYNLNDDIENNAHVEYKRTIEIPNNNKYDCYIIHLQYNNPNYIKISPVSNISHISKIKKELFRSKFKNYGDNIDELLISNIISYTDFDCNQDFGNKSNIDTSNDSLEILINDKIDNYNLNKEKSNDIINRNNINKYIDIDNNSKHSLSNELNNTIDDNGICNFIKDNSTIQTNCQFIINSKRIVKEISLNIGGNSNNLDIKNTLFFEDKNLFNKNNKSNSNKIFTNKLQNFPKKCHLKEENIIDIKINELINDGSSLLKYKLLPKSLDNKLFYESFESNYSEESDVEFQKQTILERIYRTKQNVNKFRSVQFYPNYISNFCKSISNNITEKSDHGWKADYLLENIINEEEIENPNIKINNIYDKNTIELDSLNIYPRKSIQSIEIIEDLLIEKSNNLNEHINNINIEINEEKKQINNSELINLSIIKTKAVDILNDYENFDNSYITRLELDQFQYNKDLSYLNDSNIFDKGIGKNDLLGNYRNIQESNIQDKNDNKELQNEDHYKELQSEDHCKEVQSEDHYKEVRNEDYYKEVRNEDYYKEVQNEVKYLNSNYNQVSDMNNDNNYNNKNLNIKLLNKKRINKKSYLINTLDFEKTIRPFAIPLWSTSWNSISTYKF
ncbi:uncharacterized protein CMU_025310 [Cryptosporidium muris RN66]|uniref:Uncharacterized protein n=1 Tax=Cryptosporidium muris (strain RN66) TaxID=441375 RepID=B6AAX3_CRYMR|nr:uncharacterized protein CMU_025310 [Cryptosporidium muris RN66]EEA05525.1 hypothetical protein, conserved [Cryptosporidium muris RN66]|eukprot:XP_002139874.1 hypothetical protein [Cryptosporidium muris RN66]